MFVLTLDGLRAEKDLEVGNITREWKTVIDDAFGGMPGFKAHLDVIFSLNGVSNCVFCKVVLTRAEVFQHITQCSAGKEIQK